MGSGTWTNSAFVNYTTATKGVDATYFATASADSFSVQDVFSSHSLSHALNPYQVVRECRDSDEHPNTLPVILALDVTGSMGSASVRVAQKLNEIMTTLYADKDVKDIEFCVMAIGDMRYDIAPVQMSQFESDIRIAEQLDQVYFEGGGGGNNSESYSAAWYMGVNHCDLDCWKRGQKGIIITLGDELPNPYLPKVGRHHDFYDVIGDSPQDNIESKDILSQAQKKFDIYHISIDDKHSSYHYYKDYDIDEAWTNLLGDGHYKVANLDNLAMTITDIVKNSVASPVSSGEVAW